MAAKKKTKDEPGFTSKEEALAAALKQIEKTYGEGSIMRLGQSSGLNVETISTGSLRLDAATGVGGLPRGRIIEIYGPESSGKTTLALHCVAEAQKRGGTCAFIDAEHALDPVYAHHLGVNIDDLLVSQPDDGEQALEITDALTRSGAVDIIVVDSVAALTPKQEIEGDMGDSHVGLHARLMSQALRKLAGSIARTKTIVIFINQLREKVGIVYGNPEVTTGGRALKFYATMRIEVRKGEIIKQGSEAVGAQTKVKIVKNKVAPPFRTAVFDILYGTGISHSGEVLDTAVELDIIHKAGAWFSYDGNRIGQGRESTRAYLENHPDVMNEVVEKIRKDPSFNSAGYGEEPEDDVSDAPAPAAPSVPLDEDDVDIDILGE
ncbi:MAG: recombinase RecA [Clostridia bacterium]|nr:recombinase RecA [Clostridia bacterium]